MKNQFFWLALAGILGAVSYAHLHPGPEAQKMVEMIAVGLITGKFATWIPKNGKETPGGVSTNNGGEKPNA